MLGSTVLETAIGLVFVYLVFSLIASAIAEYISSVLDRRSDHLKHILFNLFDNDDPQGRTMLNLFIAHPMIQALNSTNWKPQFQSAAERVEQKVEQFDLARNKWNAAAAAVAAADNARAAAAKATDAAAAATTAAANVKVAQKGPATTGATASPDLQMAVDAAAAAASAADASAIAAREAAAKATTAAELLAKVKKWQETPAGFALQPPARRTPAAAQVVPPEAPQAPAPPVPSRSELAARASHVLDQATRAAQAATAAAAVATSAARAVDTAKRGLDSALTVLADVPRYMPDRTFIDVIIYMLTNDNTIRALSRVSLSQGAAAGAASRGTTSLWDRFGSALAILQGVATRLPAGDAKNNVDRAIQSVMNTLAEIKNGAVEALGAVNLLEKGINDLLAAAAAVPDDSLRTALEREIQASLRPLHALGQNLLTLERAGQTIAMMADSSIKTALSAFLTQAGEDLDAFRKNVGSWFNDVMDHASGWYKRNTQYILVVIAFFLCTINNVDTVSLVGHLSSSSEMRNAALKEARAMLDASDGAQASLGTEDRAQNQVGENTQPVAPAPKNAAQMKDQRKTLPAVAIDSNASEKKASAPGELAEQYKKALDATKLPLWWSRTELENLWSVVERHKAEPSANKTYSINYARIIAKFIGLLISILAVSMGAPFWFDVLNKLVNIRLSGTRPEPSSGTSTATRPAQPATSPAKT